MTKIKQLLTQDEVDVLLDTRGDNLSAEAHEMFLEGELLTAMSGMLTDYGFYTLTEWEDYVLEQAREQWRLSREK